MCLDLSITNKSLKTAEEDILVYKIVVKHPSILEKFHGKPFKGKFFIPGPIEVEGVISISEGILYFCTNNDKCIGRDCEEKFSYMYSWEFDYRVIEVYIEGVKVIECNKILPEFQNNIYLTPYRDFPVRLGETYTSKLEKEELSVSIGLHTFKFPQSVFKYTYVECIIPKGAHYYEGFFNSEECYASDTLIYGKKFLNDK